MRTRLLLAAAAALALAAAFVGGRYSRPARVEVREVVKERVVTEWKEKIVERVVQGPVRVVTRTVERPAPQCAGTIRETEVVEERAQVETTKRNDSTISEDRKAEQTRVRIETSQPRLFVALQAGAPVNDLARAFSKPDVLATGAYRVLGPASLVGSVGYGPGNGLRVMVGVGAMF